MIKLRYLSALLFLAPLALACGDDSGGGGGGGSTGSSGGTLTCDDSCTAVVALGCANGPTTQNECVSGCQLEQSSCPDEYDAVAKCAGAHPTYDCDASGYVTVVGCESQIAAV